MIEVNMYDAGEDGNCKILCVKKSTIRAII